MDTQRMLYSFQDMHLLRCPSPNAIFDGVFTVARNLIKKDALKRIVFRRRLAQTVAKRNAMTASPEDLAEYDIEDKTSTTSDIAGGVC
ncbi:hypothetical protein BV898_04367 [Hypsibius exemplaris]|uniref:Uncharacterized protein n=1 Tax=Hypsibius exemplaris TaxID=2072580 RepID=A0A1W0X2W7_HYPEX|nr:hypothetical protein BV898_04367 [Hypsibius exemplaris]